jgi:hypothetical protein
MLADEHLEGFFGLDRDASRIARPGQRGRVAAARDARDLGSRKATTSVAGSSR